MVTPMPTPEPGELVIPAAALIARVGECDDVHDFIDEHGVPWPAVVPDDAPGRLAEMAGYMTSALPELHGTHPEIVFKAMLAFTEAAALAGAPEGADRG